MTTIAAIYDPSKRTSWMAGDRQLTGHQSFKCGPKVEKINGLLIGTAGSSSLCLAMWRVFRSTPRKRKNVYDWLRIEFSESLWAELNPMADLHYHQSQEQDSTILVGSPQGLFVVDSDLSVEKVEHEYFAIGSGGPVALGSLHGSIDLDPRIRLEGALSAACYWDGYTGPPWDILEVSSKA